MSYSLERLGLSKDAKGSRELIMITPITIDAERQIIIRKSRKTWAGRSSSGHGVYFVITWFSQLVSAGTCSEDASALTGTAVSSPAAAT